MKSNIKKSGQMSSKSVKKSSSSKADGKKPARSQGEHVAPESVAAAYSSRMKSKAAVIRASGDRVRIIHKELIGSISGSVNFTVQQTVALNPGLAASFPWLATQAQAWERYRWNSIRFCYYTRTGSTTPGSVIMIPDYDAADSAPISEQIASVYEDTEEDAPWKNISCTLRSSSLHALGPSKFVRIGSLSANQDIKTYDAGNFFLATTDGTAVSWGKLWVEYDVELFTPQLNPAGGGVIQAQVLRSLAPVSADCLAAASTIAGSASICTYAANVLTFSVAGEYFVSLQSAGGTCTQTGVPAVSASGTLLNQYVGGSGTADMIQDVLFKAVVGTTLTFNNAYVGGTQCDLMVSQVPSNLVGY